MEKGLTGKRIVIGGSRKIEEICTLIEKQGGVPIVRSLQGTVFLAEKEVEPDLVQLIKEGSDWIIFTTGIGIETLLNLAEKSGLKEQFLDVLHQANVAARGYKSHSVLKKLNIQPKAVDDDGTTKGLIRSLEAYDLKGKKAVVQLHGEASPFLIKYLENQGAAVKKLMPYQHIAPETETVKTLCGQLLANECDAVCFTTATQVQSLFDYARKQGILPDIVQAFNEKVAAAAVGKVTAESLTEEGVKRVISPEYERMGAMIIELAKYFEKR